MRQPAINGGVGDFLAEPGVYASAKAYRSGLTGTPFVGDEPAESALYLYPDSDDRNGQGFRSSPRQRVA